jgi:hypothetical protein
MIMKNPVLVPYPAGLSARSRQLWRQITTEFVLTPGDLLIFEQQLRTLDDIAELEEHKAFVYASGEMFHRTRSGLLKPHPVFGEIRALREQLQKQAAALDFPMPEADASGRRPHKPRSATTTKAQKAAQARWGTSGNRAS